MPLPPETTKVAIAELAAQLHKSRTNSLTIPVPEGKTVDVTDGFSGVVEGGQVRFASLEDINVIVAAHTLVELRAAGPLTAESLFNAAYKLWRCEIGHSDMAAGRMLASVSEVDVLLMAVERISKGAQVFDVLHLVQAFLLHADTVSLDSLVALSDAQYEKTKRDMAAGMLFGAVENWLSSRVEIAKKLTGQLLTGSLKTRENLLSAAWMGWFKSDSTAAAEEILRAAGRANDVQVIALAIWLAGRMCGADTIRDDLKKKLENLINQRLSGEDGQERKAAVQASVGLLHLTDEFDTNLSALAVPQNQEVLSSIACELGLHHKELLEQGRYFHWLDRCVSLGPDYEGAIGSMEYSLSLLIVPEGIYLHEALNFLKAWVVKQPSKGPNDRKFSETFSQCTLQILNHPTLLSGWLTDWLSGDDIKLPSSVAGVLFSISTRGSSGLRFSTEILDGMSQEELVFLARRFLGYIHDANQLLSLALSLLDMKDPETRAFPLMRSLLIEEIGYDFPGSTIDALKDASQKTNSDSVRQLLDSICLAIETGMDQLEKLPRLKELAPPSALRRQFSLARGRQMSDAAKEAGKKSIFQQIATTTYIKAAHTTFQYQRDSYTEPMQMKSISHSYQLPRRENLDPVGNAIRGFGLRNAKRGSK